MTDDTIRLRQPTADEIRAFVQPTGEAFAEVFSEAELDLERRLWELDRLIGAVDGDRWVGTGGAYSFGLTVPGGEVAAAGITMIGVTPSHRRRGILRLIMRWLFDQARERGEPVSILWASESAIYQHFGYGIGTLQSTFDIERTRMTFARPAPALGRIRLIDRDEATRLFPPIYEAVRVGIPGTVTRSEARWRLDQLEDAEWQRAANGIKYLAVLEVDGEPRGYAIYRTKSEWGEMGPNNTVLVFEVVGLDAAAERAIWEWIAGIDLVGHIKALARPRAASADAPADRATPPGPQRARGHVAAPDRPEGGARGADVRRGRVAHVRGDRRVLPLERRALAAGGCRAMGAAR